MNSRDSDDLFMMMMMMMMIYDVCDSVGLFLAHFVAYLIRLAFAVVASSFQADNEVS